MGRLRKASSVAFVTYGETKATRGSLSIGYCAWVAARVRAMRWGIVLVAVACAVFWCPASGWAAAPANDNFANREVLSGSLPIEVMGSNVEATSESGEPTAGTYGRSVWFEW